MNWTLPGTVLTVPRADADRASLTLGNLFLAGGISLGQVSSITGLESYTVQNWVKRGFLAPPVGKRYTLRQLCRILNINMLRGVLPMEKICGMLGYINGALDDESDDMIDDSQLYFFFVSLAARNLTPGEDWPAATDETLADFPETVPGARERIARVLQVMLTAYTAEQLRQHAERILTGMQA